MVAFRWWISLGLFCLWANYAQAMAHIERMRVWQAPESTRLVFDLSAPVTAELFSLVAPERVVIDMANAHLIKPLDYRLLQETPVKAIRYGRRPDNKLRLVLDLRQPVTARYFTLTPNQRYGHRLVVDLDDRSASTPFIPTASSVKPSVAPASRRDIVIVIDPGHGGEDPGALGSRLQEKDIVLAIACRLQAGINRHRGFRAVLTRTSDYYISLRQRTALARRYKADLLVSIHADAAPAQHAYGASVFAVSERGATSEMARWLADTENRSDLIGGVGSLDNKDPMLAGVLLDLSMTAAMASSLDVGQQILTQLKAITTLHKDQVEQAGFVVLKNPDFPSILIETGFISTPTEARKLASVKHQQKLANAIELGIKRYFQRRPPSGTYWAWRREQTTATNKRSQQPSQTVRSAH